MSERETETLSNAIRRGESTKSRPGRKRLGEEVFVPVTMKVEPAELATIESIAKYSGRSRSDVMREMLSYGLAHVMKGAFGGSATRDSAPADEAAKDDAASKSRTVVGTYLPSYALDVIGALGEITGQSRPVAFEGLCTTVPLTIKHVECGVQLASVIGFTPGISSAGFGTVRNNAAVSPSIPRSWKTSPAGSPSTRTSSRASDGLSTSAGGASLGGVSSRKSSKRSKPYWGSKNRSSRIAGA